MRAAGLARSRCVSAVLLARRLVRMRCVAHDARAPADRRASRSPFPAARKLEMQAYAKRHYGLDTWRLRNPKVIVEHITVSSTFGSAFATFNADVADSELHELPGHLRPLRRSTPTGRSTSSSRSRSCAGTRSASTGRRSGSSTSACPTRRCSANPRQMAASLALTTWLMSRYHIRLGDVIGHNESLTSRFHKELYAGWRCQTHADWDRADMNVVPRPARRRSRGAERRPARRRRAHARDARAADDRSRRRGGGPRMPHFALVTWLWIVIAHRRRPPARCSSTSSTGSSGCATR